MDKSPTSTTTQMIITNFGKYGIATGSYRAEFLELTPMGRIAVDGALSERIRRKARFDLAIDGVAPFKRKHLDLFPSSLINHARLRLMPATYIR